MYSIDQDRSKIVEFPYLVPTDYAMTIVSDQRFKKTIEPFKIFYTFSPMTWFLILFAFICQSILNRLFVRFRKGPDEFDDPFPLSHSAMDTFSLFMGHSRWNKHVFVNYKNDLKLKKSMQMFNKLLLNWAMCSFLLRYFFSLDIMAVLLTREEQKLDYFYDLQSNYYSDYKILIPNGSSTKKLFISVCFFHLFLFSI